MSKVSIAFSLITLTPFAAYAKERVSPSVERSKEGVGSWVASEHSVSPGKESTVKEGKGSIKTESNVVPLPERKSHQ